MSDTKPNADAPTAEKIKILFVDTNIYRRNNFDLSRAPLRRLERQVINGKFELVTTNLSNSEIQKHARKAAEDCRSRLSYTARGIGNMVPEVAAIRLSDEFVDKAVNSFMEHVENLSKHHLDSNCTTMGEIQTVISDSTSSGTQIKQNQYKDVAIFLALKKWATENNHHVHIVTGDGDFVALGVSSEWATVINNVPQDELDDRVLEIVSAWASKSHDYIEDLAANLAKGISLHADSPAELLHMEKFDGFKNFQVHRTDEEGSEVRVTIKLEVGGEALVFWEFDEFDETGIHTDGFEKVNRVSLHIYLDCSLSKDQFGELQFKDLTAMSLSEGRYEPM